MTRPMVEFASNHFKGRQDLVVAEIGVSSGTHAQNIYQTLNPREMYLVDYWGYIKGSFEEIFSQDEQDIQRRTVFDIFKDRHGVKIIQKRSRIASLDVPLLDMIYIDASHDEFSVTVDIACWYPRLKVGGVIGGHDYNPNAGGVRKAASRMFPNYFFNDCDWWYIKKKENTYD